MKIFHSVSRALGYVAMAVMIVMMLLTVADVFLRYAFDAPITGTTEMTEVMMTGLALAMAWAALEGRHITVDIVMRHMPKRAQAITAVITFLVSLWIFFYITRETIYTGLYAIEYNRVSVLLKIPNGPFYIILAVAFGILCFSIIPLMIKSIAEAFKR